MTVVRQHAHIDLALLEVRDRDDAASGAETFALSATKVPLRVARLGDGVVAAEAVGFPDAATRPDGMRRPEQPSGALMPAGGARDEHGRVPFDVSTTVPTSSPLWEGMSGAAVRDGHGRLIGVVVSVDPNRDQRRLFVIPVEDVPSDPGSAQTAYALGWPDLYEDPENAQAAIDLRKQRLTLLKWLGEFPEQVEEHSRALWRLGFGQSEPIEPGTEAAGELRSLKDKDALTLVRRSTRIQERLPELFASTNPSEWARGAFDEVYPALRRETSAWFDAMRQVCDSLAGDLKFPVEGGGSITISTDMLFSSLDVL